MEAKKYIFNQLRLDCVGWLAQSLSAPTDEVLMKKDYFVKIERRKIDYSKVKINKFRIIQSTLISNAFCITIAGWYIDYNCILHLNEDFTGIWSSKKEAQEFLLNTFKN